MKSQVSNKIFFQGFKLLQFQKIACKYDKTIVLTLCKASFVFLILFFSGIKLKKLIDNNRDVGP